jgi:hypothetical protein
MNHQRVCRRFPRIPGAVVGLSAALSGSMLFAAQDLQLLPEVDTISIPSPATPSPGPESTIPQPVIPQSAVPETRTPVPPLPADAGLPQAAVPDPGDVGLSEEDGEAMLRGPVHEAFAEQYNQEPVAGLIIPRKPPELVEELPPDVRPEGRDVQWISGYWAWDEDNNDFLWVSGIWRETPQGFRWLPGYWAETDGGFQWVPGTWVANQTAEIEYIETAPPASLEVGSAGQAPSANHIWIPGCWTWQTTRYLWRPGYWSQGYASWIWVPARYHWTPRGYYFCNGYWDYPLESRGVLFAPCYFRRPIYAQPGYFFTPRIVVATSALRFNFWVRPGYRHYYFGDYYGGQYAGRGLQPWHHFHQRNHGCDPLFAYYSRGRGNSFYNQINTQFTVFVNHPDRRPAHTLRDQNRWSGSRLSGNDHQHAVLGSSLSNYVQTSARRSDGPRFVRLQDDQRQSFRGDNEQFRGLIRQRREIEGLKVRSADQQGGANPGRLSSERNGQPLSDRVGQPETRGRRRGGVEAGGEDGKENETISRTDRLTLPPMRRSADRGENGDPNVTAERKTLRNRDLGTSGVSGAAADSGGGPGSDSSSSTGSAGESGSLRSSAGRERKRPGSETGDVRKVDTPVSGAGTTDADAPEAPVSRGERPRGISGRSERPSRSKGTLNGGISDAGQLPLQKNPDQSNSPDQSTDGDRAGRDRSGRGRSLGASDSAPRSLNTPPSLLPSNSGSALPSQITPPSKTESPSELSRPGELPSAVVPEADKSRGSSRTRSSGQDRRLTPGQSDGERPGIRARSFNPPGTISDSPSVIPQQEGSGAIQRSRGLGEAGGRLRGLSEGTPAGEGRFRGGRSGLPPGESLPKAMNSDPADSGRAVDPARGSRSNPGMRSYPGRRINPGLNPDSGPSPGPGTGVSSDRGISGRSGIGERSGIGTPADTGLRSGIGSGSAIGSGPAIGADSAVRSGRGRGQGQGMGRGVGPGTDGGINQGNPGGRVRGSAPMEGAGESAFSGRGSGERSYGGGRREGRSGIGDAMSPGGPTGGPAGRGAGLGGGMGRGSDRGSSDRGSSDRGSSRSRAGAPD